MKNANLLRVIAVAILAGGIALTIFGINASRSFNSDVSKVFTGNPTDHSMALIIAGIVMTVSAAAVLLGSLVPGLKLKA